MSELSTQRFGDDLWLLGDPARGRERDRGDDLATRQRPESGEIDLDLLSGAANLKQALVLRFLTPVGELAPLGHPEYGCRLHELIGEPNTESNRNRAKLYVLRALSQEPRVQEVVAVSVRSARGAPHRLDIDVRLRAIDHSTLLNLVFPFFLDPEANP